jgi:hypothetical protein
MLLGRALRRARSSMQGGSITSGVIAEMTDG